jgi:molybdopterin-binding protein
MTELLTAREAAALLHLHEKRVQLLARQGRLPAVRHGRKWLFRREDLLRTTGTPASAAAEVERVERGDDHVALSARNRLRGRITHLRVDGVMAEVRLAVGDQELVAIITAGSAERLRLRVGDEVFAVVKATEVMVAKPAG